MEKTLPEDSAAAYMPGEKGGPAPIGHAPPPISFPYKVFPTTEQQEGLTVWMVGESQIYMGNPG